MQRQTKGVRGGCRRRVLLLESLEDRELLSTAAPILHSQGPVPALEKMAPAAMVRTDGQPQSAAPGGSLILYPPQRTGPAMPSTLPADNGAGSQLPPADGNHSPLGPGTGGGAEDHTPGDDQRGPYRKPDQDPAGLAPQASSRPSNQESSPVLESGDGMGTQRSQSVSPRAQANGKVLEARRPVEPDRPPATRQVAPGLPAAVHPPQPFLGGWWQNLPGRSPEGEERDGDDRPGGLWVVGVLSHSAGEPLHLSPPLSPLLAGVLPFDLGTLEQGVEQFLAQLEDLGGYLSEFEVAGQATPWLVAVAAAAGAVECYRRRTRRWGSGWRVLRRGWTDPSGTWLPDSTVSWAPGGGE